MSQEPTPDAAQRVECPPAKDPAVRLFIVAGMLLAFGAWCFYDSFFGSYRTPASDEFNDVAAWWFNRICAIALPIAGIIPLAMGLRFLTRRLVADAEGIGYERGTKVPWAEVTRLDATDLPAKGILRLEHGTTKPMVLDAWKLQNFKAMVAFVEAHVPADAIEAPAGD